MPSIHPTAIIDSSARIGVGVGVGPYAIIEAGVSIGDGCSIDGHAIIGRDARIGKNNEIHHHAVIGTASQDMKYKGEKSWVELGDDNIVREFATVNRATGEGRATLVGNHCLLMAYSHVAHNCVVGDYAILANGTQLGGEVVVEEHANLGGLVGVHQFCRIGANAMVGACSKVTQDILPYITADGHPARPRGLNIIGLRRRGYSEKTIQDLKEMYKLIFCQGVSLQAAVKALEQLHSGNTEAEHLTGFLLSCKRGIARPRLHPGDLDDLIY